MLEVLRIKRDANKTPTQMAQSVTKKLSLKQKALETQRTNLETAKQAVEEARAFLDKKLEALQLIENEITKANLQIAELEQEQQMWMAKARVTQQSPQTAATESFGGLQAALSSMGQAAASDPAL
eukprot:5375119-Pyramimonas_sp.AAC.1